MIARLIPSAWEFHPPLVHFPIAFFIAGVVVDLFAWWRLRQDSSEESARRALRLTQFSTGLLIAGVLTGALAAITGLVAYFTAPVYAANGTIVMNWHLGLSLASLTLFAWVAFVRWLDWASAPAFTSRIVGLIAAVLLVAGGALGGHLVYRSGAGFDLGLFVP